MDSRDIRIEVGYGLEGVLNDGKCGRFIRNATDSLSAGDYSEGIKQIYDSVIGELEDPTPDEEDDDDTMVEIMTYVVFFIVLAIVVFITNIKGRGGRGGHMAAIVAAAVTMAADFPAEAAAEEADSPAAAEVSAAAVPAVNFNIESDVEKLFGFCENELIGVRWYVRVYFSQKVRTGKPYIEDRLACYLL